MAKLSKVNKNGTLSIVLPKTVTEGRWEAETQVDVSDIDNGMAILISRTDVEKRDIHKVLDMMKVGSDSFFELLSITDEVVKNSDGLISADYTDANRRLKTYLIQLAQML